MRKEGKRGRERGREKERGGENKTKRREEGIQKKKK